MEWFVVHAVAQQARTVKGVAGFFGMDRRQARRMLARAGVDRSGWPSQQEVGRRYWQDWRQARGIAEPPITAIAAASSIEIVARQYGCGRKLIVRLAVAHNLRRYRNPKLKSAFRYLRDAGMTVLDMGPDYACLCQGRRYAIGTLRLTQEELFTKAARIGWRDEKEADRGRSLD